jgi:hypothetical protein
MDRLLERDFALQEFHSAGVFFREAEEDWRPTENRKLGRVDWAPPVSVVHTPSCLKVFNVSLGKTRNFAKNIADLAIFGTTIRLRYLTRPPSPPSGNEYRNGQLEDKFRGKNRHARRSLPVIHYRYML